MLNVCVVVLGGHFDRDTLKYFGLVRHQFCHTKIYVEIFSFTKWIGTPHCQPPNREHIARSGRKSDGAEFTVTHHVSKRTPAEIRPTRFSLG